MNATRWRKIKTIVGNALSLDGPERAHFVEAACANDTSLKSEVDLLLSHSDADDFLETPAEIPDPDQETVWIGRQLGVYQITRELPAGGMGRVFEAQRTDGQYQDTVAVKILRASIDTQEGRQRFNAERQMVAALKHPHIAHMIDGGVVDGLPYFVMEYVHGVPMDRYCAEHELGIAARLQLFANVCAAVEFAHQQLIVHRDLKPENILISNDGTPKLLDFGIAKYLSSEGGVSNATVVGAIGPLTPRYAAPEQFLGQSISTATDVYSLGCVLYRLLTGTLPFGMGETSQLSLMEAVCKQEPARPSELVAKLAGGAGTEAKNTKDEKDKKDTDETEMESDQYNEQAVRQGLPETPALAKALRGDLDVIVQKALATDPALRYKTVAELRGDVSRYLTGRPILARAPSFGYVARKFIQRNKLPVLVSSVAMFMVVAGVIGIIWQAHIANTQRARADTRLGEVQEMAEKFIFDYYDSIKNIPGALPIAKRLADDSAKFLDRLDDDGSSDPTVLEDLAGAYSRLAAVQGGFRASNLGEIEAMKNSLQKSYTIRRRLVALYPNDPNMKEVLADFMNFLSRDAERSGNFDAVRDYCAEGVSLAEQAVKGLPNDLEAQNILGELLQLQSQYVGYHLGKYEDAIALSRKAQGVLVAILKRDSNNVEAKGALSTAMTGEGLYLREGRGDRVGSRAVLQHATALKKEMLKAEPNNSQIVTDIAGDLYRFANADIDDKKFVAAQSEIIEAKNLLHPLISGASPSFYALYVDTMLSDPLIDVDIANGNVTDAMQVAENSNIAAEKLLKVDPNSTDYIYLASTVNEDLAKIAAQRKDWVNAERQFRNASKQIEAIARGSDYRKSSLFKYRYEYSKALIADGKLNDAAATLGEIINDIDKMEKVKPVGPNLARRRDNALILMGRVKAKFAKQLDGDRAKLARSESEKYYRMGSEALKIVDKANGVSGDDEDLLKEAQVAFIAN